MRGATIQLKDSVYTVEHPETGLAFSLCGEQARLKPRDTATIFLGNAGGRLTACKRIVALLQPEAGYEIVRRDA